jgi:hypothetical protein
VPYTLTGYSAGVAVSNVGIKGVPVELVGKDRRQEVMRQIMDKHPNLIVVDYTTPYCVNGESGWQLNHLMPYIYTAAWFTYLCLHCQGPHTLLSSCVELKHGGKGIHAYGSMHACMHIVRQCAVCSRNVLYSTMSQSVLALLASSAGNAFDSSPMDSIVVLLCPSCPPCGCCRQCKVLCRQWGFLCDGNDRG